MSTPHFDVRCKEEEAIWNHAKDVVAFMRASGRYAWDDEMWTNAIATAIANHNLPKTEEKPTNTIDWPEALRRLEQHPQVKAERAKFSKFHDIKPEDLEMRFR